MKKIRALIIEDEAPARELIRFMLSDHPEIEIAGECGDGFCGAREIKEKRPDLVFLDIQMPKLTGFELLEVIDEKPEVISQPPLTSMPSGHLNSMPLTICSNPFPRRGLMMPSPRLSAGWKKRHRLMKRLKNWSQRFQKPKDS